MTITGMLLLRSPMVIVFITIASCVAGSPLQIEGENIGLGQVFYSQPELAAALARSYDALESQEINGHGVIWTRKLDHIGGSNLLRNLDESDDGKFSRDVATETKNNKFERNLDHIGGGNLLRNLNSQRFVRSKLVQDEQGYLQPDTTERPDLTNGLLLSNDDSSKWNTGSGTSDFIDGENIVGHDRQISLLNDVKRNLDRIGGGNLLRDLHSELFGGSRLRFNDHQGQSLDDQHDYQTTRHGLDGGFNNELPKWARNRQTFDSFASGNSIRRRHSNNLHKFPLQRNLDHIGGGNLLRDLAADEFKRNINHITRSE